MDKRKIFVRGYKEGYKKALMEARAWSSPAGGANIYAKQKREEQAALYGSPSGGEIEVIEIPCHVEYGLKNRKASAIQGGKRYPVIRLTAEGRFISGFSGSSGHFETCTSEYFYDPELAGLRADEEAAILRCNNHGYPRFLVTPVYNYMEENDLHDNMHNTGYKMSRVLAKYAVMVINNMLKQIPEGAGEADFTIKVPCRLGHDNVYSKIFYVNENDFADYADDLD